MPLRLTLVKLHWLPAHCWILKIFPVIPTMPLSEIDCACYMFSMGVFVVPRFRESVGTLNLIRPSVCPSVRLSVRLSQNFNLGHNFCTITDRALILGMCVSCDKTFPVVPCRDLDGDLWPTSRSNLLPSGGPQFSEFACFVSAAKGRNSNISHSFLIVYCVQATKTYVRRSPPVPPACLLGMGVCGVTTRATLHVTVPA